MTDAFGCLFSHLLLKAALPSAAALFALLAAIGAWRVVGSASRRIRRVGGILTVAFLSAWIFAMAESGSAPTREEKERMNAAQAEIDGEHAAMGELLVDGGQPGAREGGVVPDSPRDALQPQLRLPDACDVGEADGFGDLPPVTNLMLTAVARCTNSMLSVVSWPPGSRPLDDVVDIYAGTNLFGFSWTFSLDVSQCASNALFSVSDGEVSGVDGNTSGFLAAGDATDSDGDGRSDAAERFVHGTDPSDPDTDGDGIDDGEELAMGINPLLADTDGDGLGDGDEIGWICRSDDFEWYDSDGWTTEYGFSPGGWNGGGIVSPFFPVLYGPLSPAVPFYDTSLTYNFAYHCGYVSYFAAGDYVTYFAPLLLSSLEGDAGNCGSLLAVPYWMNAELEEGNTNSFMRIGYVASNGVHVVEYRNLRKYGTNLAVTMQVILPVGVGRTVRMSYLESDIWLDGSDAVVGVQNKSISTAIGFYNLTYDFSRLGPILPHTTWEYHLGYATDPRLADTDGDGFADDYEINVFHSDPLSQDGDGDGLSDAEEHMLGTNPKSADSDGDTLQDGWEVLYSLDPLSAEGGNGRFADLDEDGLANWQEFRNGTSPWLADTDGDGLSDFEEITLGTSPLAIDTDGDGLADGDEIVTGTDPVSQDTDGDGLTDGDELGYVGHVGIGTNPFLRDTDGDCLPDEWESSNGLDPLSASGEDGSAGDPDGDGLSNLSEFAFGTDPCNSHTFSPETGDADYVDYGMCAFPPLNGVSVVVSVGDPSMSQSERWKMTLEEVGGLGRRYQVVCGSYGAVSTHNVILEPERHYIGTIEHIGTDGMLADYDWTAQIDGLPSTAVMSASRDAWICIADKLVMIDNSSGLLGTCDQSFGTENQAEGKHFDVYTVSVRPTHMKFNWDAGASTADAINIRKDYGTPYDASDGEYSPSHNYPACYVTNTIPVVKAKFRVVPDSVSSLEMDAVLEGTLLSDLSHATVGFVAGESGYVDFTMTGGIASAIGMSSTNSYGWRVRSINGTSLNSPKTVAYTGPHKTYVILGEPVEPWSNEPNVCSNAWSTALDLTCQWADGKMSKQQVSTSVAEEINYCDKFVYDVVAGGPHYSSQNAGSGASFDLTSFLDRINGGDGAGYFVNCLDCASAVVAMSNLAGCDLWCNRMGHNFDTRRFLPIGFHRLLERNFVFHEVAWEGDCRDQDCVYDACLEYDGDDAPGDDPIGYAVPSGVAFSDGSELSPFMYRERLSKNGANGYRRCVNLNTRTRRVLK